MSTMSTDAQVAPRRAIRGGIISSLVAAIVVLSGCAAAGEASPAANYDMAYAEGADYTDGGGFANEAPTESFRSATDNRSVIVTGEMYITVEDPIVAADRAAGIVKNAGGRIDARSETAPGDNYRGSAALTLRIPADRLDAVVDDLRELGTVDQFSTNSYDVTNEVTDLAAKISTLRASTARIEGLLLDAKDITDIIKLENELDSRQAQLEGLEARQRGLTDQVSMSTIELSLTTEPVVILVDDESPQNFWEGLLSGWDSLVGFLSGTAIVLGLILPWLAVLILIALAIIVPVRVKRSQYARRDAMPRESAAPPPNVPAPPK